MKVLVTGGAGFIGGNFVHHMVNKYPDYQIVNLDLLTYAGNLETLKPVEDKPNYKFVKGDIADEAFIMDLFEKEKFDVVVNFAAESHVDRSIEDPGIFVQTNVMGTRVLLDASRKFGVKRYHQVSTDEVYGDLPLDRPDLFFTENTPIHTSSPYSASKASADLFVLAYHRTFGTPVTVSRCSNNYGPYHFPEKLIPLMISRALADEELPVYGNGENVRDWLHVSDHCEAIDLIIHKGKVGEVYNIGGHNEKQNIEIINIILETLQEMLPDGTLVRREGVSQGFGYRTSVFQHTDGVIVRACFALQPGDPGIIRETMRELMTRRTVSQPLDLPSAGSAFKRPQGGYAAALIESAGLKGLTVGGAQVSEKHAGFVVNRGGATAADVLELLRQVQQRVLEHSGIRLEPEIRLWD